MSITSGIIYKNTNGTLLRYTRATDCHSIVNSKYGEIFYITPKRKIEEVIFNKMQEVVDDFNKIGLAVSLVEKITLLNQKLGCTIIINREKSIKINKDSKYNKIILHLYEMFRSLIKYEELLDKVIELKATFDKMDIWDIYFLAHQELIEKNEEIDNWDTYYDPMPNHFTKYISLRKAKTYNNKPLEKIGGVSQKIQDVWSLSNKKQYKLEFLENKPLYQQIRAFKLKKSICKIKPSWTCSEIEKKYLRKLKIPFSMSFGSKKEGKNHVYFQYGKRLIKCKKSILSKHNEYYI